MIIVCQLSLVLILVFSSNIYVSWRLARKNHKILSYILLIITLIVTTYVVINIIALYNSFKYLWVYILRLK